MLRKIAVSLVALGALGATNANALGLGEVKVHSALNQPLVAEIELLQLRGLGESQVLANLAARDEFFLAGIEPAALLSDMRFKIALEGGSGVIHVTTREPVNEPFVNFLVEVNWPTGRLVREYTLLLDPPVFDNSPRKARAVAVPRTPAPAPAASYSAPAAVLQRPVAVPAPNTRLVENAPANIRQRMDEQRQYYVDVHDTLWGVAVKTRPDASVSAQQMMLAIQQSNPTAFVNNNINRLRSGVVLNIPTLGQIRELSFQESVREVERQNQLWKGGPETDASAGKQEQLDASKHDSALQGGTAASGDSQLRIVSAPAKEGASKPAAPGATEAVTTASQEVVAQEPSLLERELLAKNQELEEQLVVTLEGLDKVERDNAELFERLEALSEQLESMQRLIVLKDQQMAQLQNQADQDSAAVPPVAPAPQAAPAAATPPPPPAPVVPPAMPQKSLLDKVLQTPAYLAGIGGGVIALLGGLLVFLRRRANAQEEGDEAAVEAAMAELDRREAEDSSESGEELAAVAQEVQETADEVQSEVPAANAAEQDPFLGLQDAEDVLAGTDENELADLSMDLGVDEPVGSEIEDDFSSSLLSDDEFDLGGSMASVDDGSASAAGASDLEIGVDDLDALAGVASPSGDDVGNELDFVLDENNASSGAGQADEEDALDELLKMQDEDGDDNDLEFSLDDLAGVEAGDDGLDELDLMTAAGQPKETEEASDLLDLEDTLGLEDDSKMVLDKVEQVVEDASDYDSDLEALLASSEESAEDEDVPAFMGMSLADEQEELLEAARGEEQEIADAPEQEADAASNAEVVADELVLDDGGESGEAAPDGELDFDEAALELSGLQFETDEASEPEVAAPQEQPAAVAEALLDEQDGGGEFLLEVEEDASELAEPEAVLTGAQGFESLELSDMSLQAEIQPDAMEVAQSASGVALALDTDDQEVVAAVDSERKPMPGAGLQLEQTAESLFGLEDAEDDELEAELNAMLEEEGNSLSLEEVESVEESFGDDFLSEADEVGTKLDLARAYIDMDDRSGARDILQEVLGEGDEQQAGEAKRLLESIEE